MYGLILGSALLIITVCVTIVKWTVDYYLDPLALRRYPNISLFSGITSIPYMLIASGESRSAYVHDVHVSTGQEILRTGPESLSFSSLRAIKDIYGHSSKCVKDGNYSVQAGTHMHLADVVDKADHARKRKVLSAAYAVKNLEEWEFKVADKVERLLAQFDKREGDVLDLRVWANYFTLDAIADIGLTHRLHFLDNASDLTKGMRSDGSTYDCNFRECLYANSRANSIFGYSYSHYRRLVKWSKLIPTFSNLWTLSGKWDGIPLYLATQRLERYNKGEEKLDDFFQALMETRDGSPNNLEWGEIVAEINIMMNAGSTTTAIAITNVIYQLIKNPDCMAKLREEILAALEPEEVIAPYEKVKYLPYLRACLDESLRLFPPTPQGLTREIPPEGQEVAGEFLAGGTTVSISAYTAHRDPVVFPDAESFRPERWLGEAGKELGQYYIAFSAGARGCIGRNIAYLEQSVLVASLVKRYEFSFAKEGFEADRVEWNNWHMREMPVRVKRRGGEEVEGEEL